MTRKLKSVLGGILCLASLPVMPLNTSAEFSINEYDYTTERWDGGQNLWHKVELESDLFSYSTNGLYEDGTPSYGGGVLKTDVVDVNFIVTGVYYEDGETEPICYTLNELTEFGYSNAYCYASSFAPHTNGTELHIGDLLYISSGAFNEVYPPILIIGRDASVQVLGSGIDIFGEDFKKVLYYEMYEEPMVRTLQGACSASQSGYDYIIYDKGNLNNDDKVDLLDVVTLNKHLMLGEPIGYYAKGCADVDNNGVVNSVDSLNILKYLIGLVDSFEELQG